MGTFQDITGQKFGMLTALRRVENRKKRTVWAFSCDCGGYTESRVADVKNGSARSCGCIRSITARNNTFVDITGMTFDRLTALEPMESRNNRIWWLCRCECGAVVSVSGKDLRTGNTKSCGCLKVEKSGYKHGSLHPQYNHSLTDEERAKGRWIPHYTEWVKAVHKKFDYTCQKCKQRGGGTVIHAHHIESYASHPDKRTDVSNGITLCSKCHYALHGKYGRDATPENLREFLEDK